MSSQQEKKIRTDQAPVMISPKAKQGLDLLARSTGRNRKQILGALIRWLVRQPTDYQKLLVGALTKRQYEALQRDRAARGLVEASARSAADGAAGRRRKGGRKLEEV